MATKNNIDFQMKWPSDAELDRMFDAVPKLERGNVLDKTVRVAAKIVEARARQLAPRSKESDRKKRSKNQQAKADWNYPLWKTIKTVVRKYQYKYGLAVVGPEWPKGNKAYLNTGPRGNKGSLWGQPGSQYTRRGSLYTAGPAKPRAQVRNWIIQAFDETKSQQLEAMKQELQIRVDEMMRQ